MKKLTTAFLLIILLGCFVGCNSKSTSKLLQLKQQGDSICGVPFFGCIHGAKIIGRKEVLSNDTTTIVYYIAKMDVNDNERVMGVWYPTCHQVIKGTYVNGNELYFLCGAPSSLEDSVQLETFLLINKIKK